MRSSILLLATLLAGSAAAVAGPLVPASLDIDFRSSAWSGANNQTSFTVGGTQAVPNGPSDANNPVKLKQNATDGLGVDSKALNDDPNEVGPQESLTINFTPVTSVTGVWLTKLFDEIIDDSGKVELYNGATLLNTFFFTGNDPTGDYYVNFGGTYGITKAVFYTDPVLAGRFDISVLVNKDYSVAGFTGAVPDSGATFAMLGLGLASLALIHRRRRN